jgi:hypothetical protein
MLCLRLLTVSSPRPLNTRSVVAAAFPPFRCRSHAISRRLSCGNICAMSSICRWFRRGVAARVEVGRVPWADGLLKYQRMARKVTTRKTRTWGMLIDCSVMVALCVVWCGVVWRFGYEGGGLGSRYVGIVVSMRRGVQAVRCAGGGRKVKQTTI